MLKEVFNGAMSDNTSIVQKKILETYEGFMCLRTIVDVGGGTGTMLNLIVTKYPSIKGINFDLPHVIAEAPSYPGVEHVGGDMFISVPKGDAIFMKWISHNWGDEPLMKLLKNCHDALPQNGKVILADHILPQIPDTSIDTKVAFHLDSLMLVLCPGGKERTMEELEELAKRAGFRGFRVTSKVYGIAIMELFKEA
ncbi:hypothetical protein CDL15_Pgr006101 [Punica granatum]|nr:hypothetical protein CDL15_Pgr006101 [Punica granatum]